jgi:hypothetical protein
MMMGNAQGFKLTAVMRRETLLIACLETCFAQRRAAA